jgi:hypothetical protein
MHAAFMTSEGGRSVECHACSIHKLQFVLAGDGVPTVETNIASIDAVCAGFLPVRVEHCSEPPARRMPAYPSPEDECSTIDYAFKDADIPSRLRM